jgi:phage shock protein PspC (stress-responsive transcriptional regulator)
MEKRLHRNEHDKVVAGVASGLAEYMQVDITIVRLLFVLSTFFLMGGGLLVYIVIWIVAPVNNDLTAKYSQFNDYFKKNPQEGSMFNSPNAFSNPANSDSQTKWNTENAGAGFENINHPPQFKKSNDTGRTIGGLILLFLGVYFLLRQFDFIPHWFNIFKIYKLWPLAIIAVGITLIFKNQRKNEWDNFKKSTEEAQKAAAEKPAETVVVVDEDQKSSDKSNA